MTLILFTSVSCDDAGEGLVDGKSGDEEGSGGSLSSDSNQDISLVGGAASGSSGGRGSNGMGGLGGAATVCETSSSRAEVAPIFLAFAFDVSGSMGIYLPPVWWYDPDQKWTPVVTATRAFFEAEEAHGIYASLTLFPLQAREKECDVAEYEQPVVPMMELPAADFGSAFSDYEAEVGTPLVGGNWRGGTPTAWAFQGTVRYLSTFIDDNPDAKFAVVLVTDGEPIDCEVDALSPLLAAVGASFDDGVPTYVIGIENPTVPPEVLPDGWSDWGTCESGPGGGDQPCLPSGNLDVLHAVAEAGGTDEAFLVDTGDPESTQTALTDAIAAIRARSVSCSIAIPDHPVPGMDFDPDYIDVSLTLDGSRSRMEYDPDCESELAWSYDGEDDATTIVLCPDTCLFVQGQQEAELSVDFLCEPRPDVVK